MTASGGDDLPGSANADRPVGLRSQLIGPEFVGVRHPDLASVEVDGETVLFDSRQSRLHRLNHTASTLWVCLDGSASLDEIARDIAEVYAADPTRVLGDLLQVVRRLVDEGLLAEADANENAVRGT